MRHLSFLVLSLMVSTTVFANSSNEEGITAAEQVCSKQFLPSDVRTCLTIVRDAKYFDPQAVEVCGRQFLPSDVRNCLTGIRDKEFRPTILDACGKLFLPSDVVACLVENGKPWTPEDSVDVEKIRNGIRQALRHLRDFEVRKAEAILHAILKELES